jgi:hypothetical protein
LFLVRLCYFDNQQHYDDNHDDQRRLRELHLLLVQRLVVALRQFRLRLAVHL